MLSRMSQQELIDYVWNMRRAELRSDRATDRAVYVLAQQAAQMQLNALPKPMSKAELLGYVSYMFHLADMANDVGDRIAARVYQHSEMLAWQQLEILANSLYISPIYDAPMY